MVILRSAAVPDGFCRLRIQGTGILGIPVQIPSGICHFVIYISCPRNTLCNIRCMSCNLGSNDSLLNIIYIRKSKMLSRSYIAEKCSTAHGCNGSADG